MKLSMTILVICLIALLTNGQDFQDEIPTMKDFGQWMIKYDKHYASNDDISMKFKTFVDNHFTVQKLNQIYKDQGTEFELNQFADMTNKEFKETILMTSNMRMDPSKPKLPDSKYLPPVSSQFKDLPDSFDWRDKGAVTPVKDQGSAGTCWAFSAVQNLEGQYFMKGNNLTQLSVEQVVDCDGTINSDTSQADCGVYGGWPYLALEFVQRIGGIESEKDYSYCVGISKGNCMPCSAPGYNKTDCGPPIPYCLLKDSCQAKLNPQKFVDGLKVADWSRTSTNETEIAQQLMSKGPLSVALNAQLLQFYHRGVFNPISCDPKNLDHAVLLVGWGQERSRVFKTLTPYWIVKNSWGPKWGENGYFRILRNKGKCGINTQVVTAILA